MLLELPCEKKNEFGRIRSLDAPALLVLQRQCAKETKIE